MFVYPCKEWRKNHIICHIAIITGHTNVKKKKSMNIWQYFGTNFNVSLVLKIPEVSSAFQNFNSRAVERNGSIASSKINWFKGRLASFLDFLTETFFFNFIIRKEVKKTVANFFFFFLNPTFLKKSPPKKNIYIYFFF